MHRILIHKIDHIGDTLLATPAIRALKESFPEAAITALVTPLTKPVLEGNLDINELIIFDKEGAHKTKKAVASFNADIQKKSFDTIISFSAATKDYHMIKQFGGSVRAAPVYNNMWHAKFVSRFTLTKRILIEDDPGKFISNPYPIKHEILQNLLVVEALGAKAPKDPRLILPVGEEDKVWAKEQIISLPLSLKTSRIVGVQLSSRWFWPPVQQKGVAHLLATLTKFYPAGFFIIFHDESEKEMANALMSVEISRNMKYFPPLPLKRYAAMIKHCHAIVTMHSGTTHIAGAMGVPVVVVFRSKWFEYFSIKEAPWKIPYAIIKKPWDGPVPNEMDENKLENSINLHSREAADRLQTLLIDLEEHPY